MKQATLVGPLGLDVIEPDYTVGPTRPGLDGCVGCHGLGIISQQNWWSTARSGGQNGLGLTSSSKPEIQLVSVIALAAAGAAGGAALMQRRGHSTALAAGIGGGLGALIAGFAVNQIVHEA